VIDVGHILISQHMVLCYIV